jgi:hypothetical protein
MLEPHPAVGPVRALPADALIELEFRGRLRELVPERARFGPRIGRLRWAAGGRDPRRPVGPMIAFKMRSMGSGAVMNATRRSSAPQAPHRSGQVA